MLFRIKKVNKFDFLEEGEGRPVVLLHGLMGGLSNFDSLTHYFAERGYRVYVPKLPIYSLPLIRTNVSSIAKYVKRFLESIVKEPAILIGNSLGGHVGLIITHDYPSLVDALVLTGSSGLYEKSFGETFPKRGDYEYVKRKTQEVFFDPAVATKEIVDEVYETVNNRRKALKTLYIARSAMKHNMKNQLGEIKQPVCLIWGKQDSVTPPEVALDFEKYLPHCTLYWIDNCGHAPMMEYSEVFNEVLYKWMKENKLDGY